MLELKDKNSVRHVNSFFVEIIMVIFFFSISCAILIQVFAKAFEQIIESEKINSAMLKGQAINELFSSSGDIEYTLTTLFGSQAVPKTDDNLIILSFDKDWNLTDENTFYTLMITFETKDTSAGELSVATIEIINKSNSLYLIKSSAYTSSEVPVYE